MARDVFPVVKNYLSCDNAYLKKKACLAMTTIVQLVPDMIDDMVRSLPKLLCDSDHGVLVSGTCIVMHVTE